MFQLKSSYKPTGDQPEAIDKLTKNLEQGVHEQVLVGVTGSGKTFTMANVIQRMQRPTLIISHNKTLAGQLYQEFRDYFPDNAVSYFVSYYDYYQPEAYIPSTDTYIEKETEINEEIDKMRLAATANILTRRDTIVVASVSCIYNIGSPKEYGGFILELKPGMTITRESIMKRLVQLQYERSDFGFHRSTFRVRGETIDLFLAYDDVAVRMTMNGNILAKLQKIDPLTSKELSVEHALIIYPAKHYMTNPATYKDVFKVIRDDLDTQINFFKSQKKFIEAQRIEQKVNYDLEMIEELGFVNGIENYSRYFDGRNPGDPPYTLLDYFAHMGEWLLIIDESHMSVPQIRGMYNGDRSRKQTLIDYGFRLPAAIDNRPLRFEEFQRIMPQTVYVSATPDEWEVGRANSQSIDISPGSSDKLQTDNPFIVEQLVRPTGLLDPEISIRPIEGQIQDLLKEITIRVERKERVLVTTLTKRMAEDLATYLEEQKIKVQYLHSDIETLKRGDVLDRLRSGEVDVVVGINLLREGLDLPEVSLVAILDAAKEGFLRSRTSLIQTMGRAARHASGTVVLYADVLTKSIVAAVEEVKRRREVQIAYNHAHGITPRSIEKPIREKLVALVDEIPEVGDDLTIHEQQLQSLTPKDKKELVVKLTKHMRSAAHDLNFELAAKLRDLVTKVKSDGMV